MRIAIISDTHNNWNNFKKAIDWINKEDIRLILHCGDIDRQETIESAQNLFNGDIKFAKGNADHDLDLPEKLELEIGGRKIALAHFPNIAKKLAQSQKHDIVFYGHTHRPWDEKVDKCHMINPGELAGQFYKPSFAVFDTDTSGLELKVLENLCN